LALLIAVSVVGCVALGGFFCTKTQGWGKYTLSALLLLMAMLFASLCFAAGFLKADLFGSIMSGVIGFTAGLFRSRKMEGKLEGTEGKGGMR
jgi:hypothetical protein